MNTKFSEKIRIKMSIAKEFGFDISPNSKILDFGCGSGRSVVEWHSLGYQAFGCDIKFRNEKNVDTQCMQKNKLIRLIDLMPYKLPFDDDTFDYIFSDQVFEHVKNYSETISELNRVLKLGGCCIHIFPSKFIPIEPHIYVPFSSFIRSYAWLHFWARAGIRNKFQNKLSPHETVKYNLNYLNNNTNYLSKKQITKHFKIFFNDVIYCEKFYLKNTGRGRYIYAMTKIFPLFPLIYSAFRSRVLLSKNPIKRGCV